MNNKLTTRAEKFDYLKENHHQELEDMVNSYYNSSSSLLWAFEIDLHEELDALFESKTKALVRLDDITIPRTPLQKAFSALEQAVVTHSLFDEHSKSLPEELRESINILDALGFHTVYKGSEIVDVFYNIVSGAPQPPLRGKMQEWPLRERYMFEARFEDFYVNILLKKLSKLKNIRISE